MFKKVRNYILRRKIEKVLGFKLHKWQVDYIFNNKEVVAARGRACGKTIAHQLKLLLDYKAPPLHIIPLTNFREFTDMPWSSLKYTRWYAKELYTLFIELKSHGIKVRNIILM